MASDTVQILLPDPFYSLLTTERGGLPEVVVVNKALQAFAHPDLFEWCLSLQIVYHDHAENEMPTPAEGEKLSAIGNALEDAVGAGLTDAGAVNALFVARSTWGGSCELLFQVHDPECADKALQALTTSQDWALEWSYEMKADPAWDAAQGYLSLCDRVECADA